MILRSMLFVPADSERKLEKARDSRADALILDLEDSVAAANRPRARELLQAFAKSPPFANNTPGPALWVRINPVDSADCTADLDAVMATRPAGVVVPKPDSPEALRALDRGLCERERAHGLAQESIRIIPVATETPAAVLSLFEYRNPPPRLEALTWGAEDLSAALGAASNRDEGGEFAFTYKVVRSLCLIAAKTAGVAAIETLHADFRDHAGLERVARTAQRDGFSGMLAIHPDQVDIINAAFTPSDADVAHARRVVAAFSAGAGVASLEGRMLDQPHLKQAQHILHIHETLSRQSS